MGMTFISNSHVYDNYRKWYCPMCNHRTETEFNAQWESDGRPKRFEIDRYSYIARCSVCHYERYTSQYNCHYCGRPTDGREPISSTEPRLNDYYSFEFGVTGYDWQETHRCSTCGRRYSFSNSTC